MFNWDEFKNEKVAVNCTTEASAKKFIGQCYERGLFWAMSSSDYIGFSSYESDTCYTYNFSGDNVLEYCNKKFYKDEGCRIIEFDTKYNTFKAGDIVKAIDDRYGVTNKSNNFMGVVLEVVDEDGVGEYKDLIVKSLYNKPEYKVNSKHFELYEKTKFKIGDKVEIVNNGRSYTTHTKASSWIKEEFGNKPYNYNNLPKNGSIGVVTNVAEYRSDVIIVIEIGEYSYLIGDDGIKLCKLNKFTFKEVISRNIPGLYVNCSDSGARVNSILIRKDGSFNIDADFSGLNDMGLGLGINENLKFRLKTEEKYTLYKVIHGEDGKAYTFRSKDDKKLKLNDWVICDTSMGKSFGRVVERVQMELEEEEFEKYKECWIVA